MTLEESHVTSKSCSRYLIHSLRRVLQHPRWVYLLSFIKVFISLRVEMYISDDYWSK